MTISTFTIPFLYPATYFMLYFWISNFLLYTIFRYPYFGEEIPVNDVKFGDDETFIDFGTTFVINHKPFKDAPLWDSLFPLSKKWIKLAVGLPIEKFVLFKLI